jgi:hypothetical protein
LEYYQQPAGRGGATVRILYIRKAGWRVADFSLSLHRQIAFMLLGFINRQGCLHRKTDAVVPNVQPDICCPAVPFYKN